jgi:hypothetical protein
MNETILIHFSGRDQAGLTAELTAILARYDTCVLDIGQAVVHETLSLGLLVDIPQGESSRGLPSPRRIWMSGSRHRARINSSSLSSDGPFRQTTLRA